MMLRSHPSNIHGFLVILLFFATTLVLGGCNDKDEADHQVKPVYTISLGKDRFQIPADYLPDARDRQDGHQESVIIMGVIPSVDPLENGSSYRRFPQRGEKSFRFILKERTKERLVPDALLRHWATQGHYTVPDTWDKEGLVHLGIFMVGGRLKDNIYAYVQDGKPIAQLRCATYPDTPNPGCNVYQLYRDYISISSLGFDIENLDWYAEEGMDTILRTVESWRIKPEQE